jgi:uncharacterized membrane protein
VTPHRSNDGMSERPTSTHKTSHPLRLALRMTVGAFAGFGIGAATHAVGNGFDPWFRSAPYIYAIIGSLIGLAVELYARLKDNRVSRELLLAVGICVVLAIAWARVH